MHALPFPSVHPPILILVHIASNFFRLLMGCHCHFFNPLGVAKFQEFPLSKSVKYIRKICVLQLKLLFTLETV